MKGFFSPEEKTDFQEGFKKGKAANGSGHFEFVLTVISRDVEKMVNDPAHKASIFGTMLAPCLSPEPISATEGTFQLFVKDPEKPDVLYMKYKMKLFTQEGEEYFFDGYKVVRDDKGFDMWSDTTTLYITVYEKDGMTVKGKGILKIAPTDFMKQITTVQAIGTQNFVEKAKAIAMFTQFFSKKVMETYF